MNPFIQLGVVAVVVTPLVIAGTKSKSIVTNRFVAPVSSTETRTVEIAPVSRHSLTDPLTPHARVLGKPMAFGVKGKWTVVNFWATWCAACRRETPNLVALHEKYSPLGIEFVGVNLDTDRNAMNQYAATNKMKWPQVITHHGWKSPVVNQYSVPSIPAIYLVSPDGKVIEAGIRGFVEADRRLSYHLKK